MLSASLNKTFPSFLQVSAVKTWTDRGTPRDKIVLGFAGYGSSYTLNNTADTSVGAAVADVGRPGPYRLMKGQLSYYEVFPFCCLPLTTPCRDIVAVDAWSLFVGVGFLWGFFVVVCVFCCCCSSSSSSSVVELFYVGCCCLCVCVCVCVCVHAREGAYMCCCYCCFVDVFLLLLLLVFFVWGARCNSVVERPLMVR